ncbi:hypothetical protein JOD07_001717 [Defluviitalea raffinosedens]|nr:hypothetical protein [Defluviitalea raffinosedens]
MILRIQNSREAMLGLRIINSRANNEGEDSLLLCIREIKG